jgi:hypothetical protein
MRHDLGVEDEHLQRVQSPEWSSMRLEQKKWYWKLLHCLEINIERNIVDVDARNVTMENSGMFRRQSTEE